MTSMSAAEQIDQIISELTDWRGDVLAEIRRVILEADPDVTEAIKWRGAPVWVRDGNICVAGVLKSKVKLTFPNGAHLPDPDNVFNNGLDGSQWRALDVHEHDVIHTEALKALVRAAVDYNQRRTGARTKNKAGAKTKVGSGTKIETG